MFQPAVSTKIPEVLVKKRNWEKKRQWQRELLQAVRNHDYFSRSNQQWLDLEHRADILVQVACTAHGNLRWFSADGMEEVVWTSLC